MTRLPLAGLLVLALAGCNGKTPHEQCYESVMRAMDQGQTVNSGVLPGCNALDHFEQRAVVEDVETARRG